MRAELESRRDWRMGGQAIVIPLFLRLGPSSQLARPGVDPVLIPVWNRVPGMLFAARYDSTSTLSYSELGIGIFARTAGGRSGYYCSSLWVDGAEAMEAGPELWGLPKEIARFDWEESADQISLSASAGGAPLLRIEAPLAASKGGSPLLSLPMSAKCFSFLDSGAVAHWRIRSRSVSHQIRAEVRTPAGSPLFGLGIEGRRRGLILNPLHLIIKVPGRPGPAPAFPGE